MTQPTNPPVVRLDRQSSGESFERKMKFENLPDEIKQAHHANPHIHMFVSAYLRNCISEGELWKQLSLVLVRKNADLLSQLMLSAKYFGFPTTELQLTDGEKLSLTA